jgi:hypothetical protein
MNTIMTSILFYVPILYFLGAFLLLAHLLILSEVRERRRAHEDGDEHAFVKQD